MRVVVTGREGQVVRSILERGAAAGFEVVALGRPELDLSGSPSQIASALQIARPDAIVSAAAYTAVDKAESDSDAAYAINASGAGAVASVAKALSVPLIHLSTDYVFDGWKASPYLESDLTGPTGVYGASKLAGERAVLDIHANAAILRTAWVYSPFGTNFVKTMLRLAADRDEVGVVADQHGNPTSALDIADGILAVARNLTRSDDPVLRGVFHMTGQGEASWADFADEVFSVSRSAGGPFARVRLIATKDFPTPAKRPTNSRLDNGKLARLHGVRLPEWRGSTGHVVHRLVRASTEGMR